MGPSGLLDNALRALRPCDPRKRCNDGIVHFSFSDASHTDASHADASHTDASHIMMMIASYTNDDDRIVHE